MSLTRAQIKYEIWTRLNKSAATKGFYQDGKVETIIQECLDYIGTEMFLADGGFAHKMDFVTTSAGQVAVPIPNHWGMIVAVRYLFGDVYEPIDYDQNFGGAEAQITSGQTTAFPSRYRIVDNNIYFNPALSSGGANYLQVEFMAYPRRFQNDADKLDGQFDRCMLWALVYMACDKLVGQLQQSSDNGRQADIWVGRMRDLLAMRIKQVVPIKEFEG